MQCNGLHDLSSTDCGYQDWTTKTGIYKTELIQDGINVMWFANRSDEGIIYNKYFNPMPIKVIALMLTAVSHLSRSYP